MMDGSSFQLEVSIDASGIEGRAPRHMLKVLAYRGTEPLQSAVVHLDGRGEGAVVLACAESPGALRVAVGPADATDAQLIGAQTLGVDVAAHRWEATRVVRLAVKVPQFYWSWWLLWSRRFSIRGRVLRSDGVSPAVGVDVAAFDVRWWWWWSSRREVGAARTDANGSFTIHFDWCCGLRPWWWWRERSWRVEPTLAERILGLLEADPGVRPLPRLHPVPDLSVFADLVGDHRLLHPPSREGWNPAVTSSLRAAVLGRLPASPELERLGVWPWRPWNPWWDRAPNINFTGVQVGADRAAVVVVDEGLGDVRLDVPTSLAVTLRAGSNALRTAPASLWAPGGGVLGVLPGPVGYASSGANDRTFGGSIRL
jgi:hypothetical protein